MFGTLSALHACEEEEEIQVNSGGCPPELGERDSEDNADEYAEEN